MSRRRRIAPLEEEIQAAFFEWWELWAPPRRIPTQLCFAIPNGGHRHPAVAAKLKAQGVRAGVSDVFLMVPAGGFHALILEFKRQGEKVKPGGSQEAFISEVRLRAYNALVVQSTEEAIRAVQQYLARADREADRVAIRV